MLFMCHLSVEKILKALYEAELKKIPPKTHNLVYLLNALGLKIPDNLLRTLELLNDMSIVTKYPEDMDELIKAFKRKRVNDYFNRTKELLKWLRKDERLKKP